jgi:hypothetical protein
MTDFNDLALEDRRLAKHQLEEAVWQARQQGEERAGEIGKGVLRLDSWAGRREIACEILKETPHRFLVRLGEDCLLPEGRHATKGQDVYLPKDSIRRDQAVCVEFRAPGGALQVRDRCHQVERLSRESPPANRVGKGRGGDRQLDLHGPVSILD